MKFALRLVVNNKPRTPAPVEVAAYLRDQKALEEEDRAERKKEAWEQIVTIALFLMGLTFFFRFLEAYAK